MALAFVESQTASNATGSAVTTAFSTTTVAGQLIVVSYADDSATTTTLTSITDNKGNTYTAADSFRVASVTYRMYYAVVTTGGTGHTVTATWSTAAAARATVVAQYFNGFTGTPTLDKATGTTGSSTSANPGTTAATTVAAEIVVVGAAHASTTSAFSLGTGYTNLGTVNVANAAIAQESKIVAATGTQTGSLSIALSRAWSASIATFYNGVAGTPPTVTTSAATSVTATTATGNGNVTSDNGFTITERGVVWATTANPTTANSKATASGTTGAYTASMTGLSSSTTYHYRAYAINSGGTSYGSDTTFTTLAPNVAPTIVPNTADLATFSTTTPTLQFTATDTDSDDVEYEIQIDTSSTFSSLGFNVIASTIAGGTTATTTTTAIDTSGANLIVVGVSHQTGTGPTITDSASNTWTALTESNIASGVGAKMYYCYAPTTSSSHTFTDGSGGSATVGVLAVSGATSSPFDLETGATSTATTTVQTGSITPSLANELLVTMFGFNAAGTPTSINSSFTKIGEVDFLSGNHYGGAMGYLVQTTAAAVNPTWTRTNSQSQATRIASFKSSGGSALDKVSTTDAGFVDVANGADTHPFTSGNLASFTVQAGNALSFTTYYWRVRAIDPSGSNTYSSWTTTRSFTISSGTAYTQSLTASVSPTGSFAKRTGKALTAGLSSTGSFIKQTFRSITASLSPTGAFTKRSIRSAFTASLSPSATLAGVRLITRAFTASLSPSGTFSKKVNKALTASVSPAGAISKRIVRGLTASLSPAGAFTKRSIRAMTASLSPTAAFAKSVRKSLTAGMTSSGSFSKRISRNLTASLTPAGSFSRTIIKFITFTANMTFTGSLGTLRKMILTANLTFSGSLLGRWLSGTPSVFKPLTVILKSGLKAFTQQGGSQKVTDANPTNKATLTESSSIANVSGAGRITNISSNTNKNTLDNPTNKADL